MKTTFSPFYRFGALALCGAAALAGCGGGEEAPAESGDAPEATESTEAAAPAAEVETVAVAGLAGKISFEGTPPEMALIEAEGDPRCAMMHDDSPLVNEQVVVAEDGSLANVFIYVKNAPEGSTTPETSALLDQVGCTYIPHVLGVQVGQPLEIRNSDETTHNVRGIARKNKAMNYGQPVGSPPRTKTFKKAEMKIRMKCDLHPWMTAYVFAMEHPYFAVSAADGSFVIPGLPAGDYDIIAWHERFDEQEGTVTVAEDGTGSINFTFSE